MEIKITIINFPEIALNTRDAHKLRGYFGNMFRKHSELLNNHYINGASKYKYPFVQYKIIDKVPFLLGLQDGSELLNNLFLNINKININDNIYPILSKNISNKIVNINSFSELKKYRFKTLWMGLNQKNYKLYSEMKNKKEQLNFLNKQIQNNILSFYKAFNFYIDEKVMATTKLVEKSTNFKNQKMIAFDGSFVTNAELPDLVGIGKSVARGFGTIIKTQ